MKRLFLITIIITLFLMVLIACEEEESVGSLHFVAYGEDFINNGFTDKDGWEINFDHVYLITGRITACQGERIESQASLHPLFHSGHDTGEADCTVHAHFDELVLVDLVGGYVDLGTVSGVTTGKYRSMTYYITLGSTAAIAEQNMNDYSLKMIGTAEKDSTTIDFTISVAFEMKYSACGMIWEDDESNLVDNSGVVADGTTGEMEITIHIDHIFGDIDNPELDSLALGFDAFAALDTDSDGVIDVTDADLSTADQSTLLNAAETIGHAGGEGECTLEEL